MVHGENQGTRLTDHYTCDGCCVVWQMFPLSREGEHAEQPARTAGLLGGLFPSLPPFPFSLLR